ncbi:MAG: DNA gyrase/topoisomerase IV subunit A [Rhodoglobus sp.]
MATPTKPSPDSPSGERIEDIDVTTEMQGSFLEYAYSVIYSRALPDARDGLKPVQRRILYQMSEMGLRPERGHVKSSRVVGDVMGKLHPHGDASIYDAMVRLAQSFILRVPLIDGHGNFGSLDDGPAAPRYTEARLQASAIAMTDNLDEDVVDFVPNYDNSTTQPEVLPAAFPNLLVNGASGIAVGMATNMAPHNLIEVVGAARYLLSNPQATLEELMQFVPGPDLPTGGTIIGLAGVADAYATGRGAFKTRAKVTVESITARKMGLVVTELPYLVGPERVIEKIKDGVNAKKIVGISDVTDLTDRNHGLRLVIGIKTGFSPDAVLEQLYRLTPLEDNFSINAVTLVDGRPQTLGLKELLEVFLKHRLQVVTRRSTFRLTKHRARLHLVEGLLIAIVDIDEVIAVIRQSDDSDHARSRLRVVFDLSELQAEYILELRLRRLTKFSTIELEAEAAVLRAEIARLEALLADEALIRALVSDELEEVADKFGTPRRTMLTQAPASIATTSRSAARKNLPVLEIADEACVVLLSTTGRVIRVGVAEGETLLAAPRRSKHDAIRSRVTTTSRTEIGAITHRGRLIRFTAVDLPSVPSSSVQLDAGATITEYLGIDRTERVIALVSLDSDVPVALGTRLGTVKRVIPGSWPSKPECEVIALKEGDELVGAAHSSDDDELTFITSNAQLLHFTASAVRPQGLSAGGMAGIRVDADASVIFFDSIAAGSAAVAVTVSGSSSTIAGTDPGRAKVSDFDQFPAKGRGTGGVRAHSLLKGEDSVMLGWVGAAPATAVAPDGAVRELPTELSKRDASGTPLAGVIGSIGTTP